MLIGMKTFLKLLFSDLFELLIIFLIIGIVLLTHSAIVFGISYDIEA
jgi:hypothetical protein